MHAFSIVGNVMHTGSFRLRRHLVGCFCISFRPIIIFNRMTPLKRIFLSLLTHKKIHSSFMNSHCGWGESWSAGGASFALYAPKARCPGPETGAVGAGMGSL